MDWNATYQHEELWHDHTEGGAAGITPPLQRTWVLFGGSFPNR